MSSWIRKTIGELCDLGGGEVKTGPFGSQLHQSDYTDEGTPVVMPTDIQDGTISEERIARVSEGHVDRLAKHKLSKGDIIYGRRGDIGRQALVRESNVGWLCGTGCLRVTLGDSEVIPEYLHLYLKMPEVIGWIQNQAIGATMPNLNTQILRRVPIFYPESKYEQKKIVAATFVYDDLIENNKRRIALLEKMAEEIYREWFVRFRFPGYQTAEFEKGIPKGWASRSSDDVLDVLSGGTPKTDVSAYWDGDIPFFTPKDAGEHFHVMTTEKNISENGLENCNSKLYEKNIIFITARGTVGKIAIAHREMAMNQSCYALRPKDKQYYYYYFLSMRNAVNHIKGVSKSGVFDNIVVDTFKIIPLLVPTKSVLSEFDDLIAPIFEQVGQLSELNMNLEKTKDMLLPRLISGKLSVADLDIQFPPSMLDDEAA